MTLSQWATIVGGFGTGVAVVVAMAAIVPAVMQISNGRRLTHEANALHAHREFLTLCFDNPEFSSTELFKKAFPNIVLAQIGSALVPASEKYLWFLSIMLNTCEQILNSVSSEGPWSKVVEAQISYHAEALKYVWPEWRSHYGIEIQDLVGTVLQD